MTASKKFNGSSTETITTTMAARRDAINFHEIERGKELESQGFPNALIQAHIETIFGRKNDKPSPTPAYNPNFPGPRPQA